ncbi:MAG: response regulator [Acidimicrobiia bacterium]|nr:response regulator [Acidimicrobiia bacterium]NNC75780.1 response regulator [Acidimicrobiia bacterium]
MEYCLSQRANPLGYVSVERTRVLSERPQILIVEDSSSVRRLIEVSLRSLDADLHEAADGFEAVERISELKPDVVVLDIGLPGLDGWEVLSRLRADAATDAARVLVLTAHAEPEVAAQAAAATADHFMTKPFNPTVLREAVERLLGHE